jgi:hypothetical protein
MKSSGSWESVHGQMPRQDFGQFFLTFLCVRRPDGIEDTERPSLPVARWRQRSAARMDEGEAGWGSALPAPMDGPIAWDFDGHSRGLARFVEVIPYRGRAKLV